MGQGRILTQRRQTTGRLLRGRLAANTAGAELVVEVGIGQVVDWSKVDKEDYLLAMERSPIKDVEIKVLLKAALTEMETAQAKFEADKLLRLQQSKDREQGIIKASNEATNKFIAEQEAAAQKQLEDLQEARVKSKMSGREEAQYDAGRNAELVFSKEEAAQL